jgi:predicted enzyme related to lactoylglutathione lyase
VAEVVSMLDKGRAYPMMPASDIERGKSFYADKLELKPSSEMSDGSCIYELAEGGFVLFPSMGKASGDHTQLGIEFDDLDAVMERLRANGVVFEEYDLPGFTTVDGIVHMPDGGRGAWFKDSEGNLIALGEGMSPKAD